MTSPVRARVTPPVIAIDAPVKGSARTVNVPLTPSTVAVMVAVPGAAAVTRPKRSTVATSGEPLSHVTSGSGPRGAVGMLGASAQPHGGAREEAFVGGGRDDHPRDGGPIDSDRQPQRDRFACGSTALLDQRGDQLIVPRLERGDHALPHPHRRPRPHQPHHRVLDAGPRAGVAGNDDARLVPYPH